MGCVAEHSRNWDHGGGNQDLSSPTDRDVGDSVVQ